MKDCIQLLRLDWEIWAYFHTWKYSSIYCIYATDDKYYEIKDTPVTCNCAYSKSSSTSRFGSAC